MKFRTRIAFSAFLMVLGICAASLDARADQAGKKRVRESAHTELGYSEGLRLGFQAGLLISSYSRTPDDLRNASRLGFVGGAQLEVPIVGVLYLQPEARFVQKGFRTDNGLTGVNLLTFSFTAPAIEVPLLAKVKLLAGAPVMPVFTFGPAFQFRVGGDFTGADSEGRELQIISPTFEDFRVKSFAFGLDFGAGAEFAVSRSIELMASFRFTLGLTNETEITSSDAKYRGIQILTGMSFAL